MVWSHTFEQHSASFMQALLFAVHATHWPLEHFVLALVQSLFAQHSWQLPLLQQSWPEEHAAPLPQTQVLLVPQVLPLVQSLFAQQSWQLPLQQCWPGEHAFPQAPQLLESVCSLTHMPPQQLSPF